MSKSHAPPRSSSPPPSLPRELWARARLQTLREELADVPDPRVLGLLELELGALFEHELSDREQARDCYLRARHHQPSLLPALFSLARICADAQRPREAAEIWQALARKTGSIADRASALCEAGILLYDQLDAREQALELWTEALALDASCISAALLLEQHERAALHAKEAERLASLRAGALRDPELQASIWVELASSKARQGQREAALELLERAIASGINSQAVFWQLELLRRPRDESHHGRIAALEGYAGALEKRAGFAGRDRDRAAALLRDAGRVALRQAKHSHDAAACYGRALGFAARDPLIVWERLLAHEQAGDHAAAASDARALLDAGFEGPLATAVRVRLARCLEAKGEHAAAVRELERAVEIEPNSAAAAAFLEEGLLQLGQSAALREQMVARAARAQGQARAERLLQAGRIALLAERDTPGALELMRRAAAAAVRPEALLRARHAAACFAGDAPAAVAAAEALCAALIEPKEIVLLRFDQYQRLRASDKREAALALLGAIVSEPTHAGWAPHAARVQAAGSRNFGLLAQAHRALAAQARDGAVIAAHLCGAARALLRAADAKGAAEELRRALLHAPDDAYALALLEESLLLSGGEREVARLLRESARSHADLKQRELALLHAGVAAEAVGDTEAAAHSYEEAIAHEPTSLGPLWALLRLAERSRDAPLFERALTLLAEREDQVGGDGLFNLELGEMLLCRGQTREASGALERALGYTETGAAAALALCLLPEAALALPLRDRALRTWQDALGHERELALLRDGIAAHLRYSPDTGKALLEAALSDEPGDVWLACHALSARSDEARAERWQRLGRAADDPNVAVELTLHAARVGLLEQGSAASEDALLRALQAAAQAPESLSAAVALDETLAASDDPESRAVAIFGRMPYASTEVSRSLRSARARALLGAGRTREAADAARRALAQNPDDLGALDLLRVAARTLGDFATVADAAQRLAQHAQGRWRAQLLEEAALVLEREFGQHAEAERCLQAALEQDPTSELAFARLHDLLLERRDTDALLTLLARRADKSEDAGARAELCYEQALILRAAGRKSETVAVLERVLADDAEHSAALGLLVETCTALEHWEATVAALRRLALANVPDEQKRLARLGAAEFLERKLGDVEGALRELELLRSAGIRDRDVLARIGGLRERLQRYRPAVEAYREAAAQSTLAARAELERRAGDVLRDHLSASNEAIAAYGRALEAYALDDVACGSLLELSEDVELRGRVLSDFERELRSAIEREPARPELLRILRRLGSWRARRDLELVALSALHALGAVDAHERKDLEALRDAARRKTQIALSDAALARLSDLVGQAELARAAQLVSQALAAQDQAPTGAVQLDDRTRAEAAEQRLELGRNAMASRLGVLPLLARTRAARREALRAGLGLGGAGSGSPEFEALSKQIGKRLARAQRKELARLAAQLTRPEVQLDAYLDLLELCLARAGLLLADDLGVALAQVAAAGGAGAELETFAGAPRALDLLRFWLSPRLLELRRELGWGP